AVILLISGLAFATGFLKEGVANEIEETKITIANNESLVEKINNKISDIMILDQISLIEARNEIQTAKGLAWELDLKYAILNPTERNLFYGPIANAVNSHRQLVMRSNIGKLIKHFIRDASVDDCFLANESFDGFNYSISKVTFDNYNSNYSLAELFTIEDFLDENRFENASGLAAKLWSSSLVEDRPYVKELDVWVPLFRTELYVIQQRLSNYTIDLASLESVVSYYNFGITAITITTIFATAMANRISDKENAKEFSPVKAKILEDDKYLITKTKKWPMALLFVALILAIAGLLIPPLIGLLT
ncbi:MAG: hypothetical protein KAQ95_09740, partial [Candidatus Heimdallarchaeota archaeon]|nr:hypothetical protein [Candidatus Heimdallarchaeota archaeon]